MDVEDRLARLERRFMVLEALVRRQLPLEPTPDALVGEVLPEAAAPPEGILAPALPILRPLVWQPEPSVPQPAEHPEAEDLSTEQWFGQRGVLGVGVLLLILAAAYFLKIAIDRGWISPAARCIAAVVCGGAVAALGWRAHRRGTEVFGAALIGAGAGMMYLAVWAATSWYSLLSLEAGNVCLAVVSIATCAVAYRFDIEALGAAAAFGALIGPIVISAHPSATDGLLLYIGGVGISLGITAVHRQWHATTLLIVLTSLVMGLLGVQHASPTLGCAFATVGGLACLSLRRRWVEIGSIGFLGAWALLIRIPLDASAPWLAVAGGLLLAAPIWWAAFGARVIWPDAGVVESVGRWSLLESLLFYLVPLMIGATITIGYPSWVTGHPGALPLVLAVPYLMVGYSDVGSARRSRPTFALVGTTAAGFAAFNWPGAGISMVVTLLGLSLLWSAVDHIQGRRDGRWYSLIALGWAGIRFASVLRATDGAAFIDSWALTLWLAIGVLVILAVGVWKVDGTDHGMAPEEVPWHHRNIDQTTFLDLGNTLPPGIRSLLWLAAGTLLFGGVTNELPRLIGQRGFSPDVTRLASGLAVSAWWAVFAGGLVLFGFYRRLTAARIAGLFVAALAAAKVLFFDLDNLDQLYRVASVIVTAIVFLLVAYLYHRKAAERAETP